MSQLQALKQSWPVYVTRPTADELVLTYSLNAGWALFILFLVALNATVWGVIGLVEAVRVIL